jgi:hypothetical protein
LNRLRELILKKGKLFEILQIVFLCQKFILFRNRVKRDDSNTESRFNLYINTLIVIDRTIYVWFKEIYSTMSDSLIINYIKIFFSYLINGV